VAGAVNTSPLKLLVQGGVASGRGGVRGNLKSVRPCNVLEPLTIVSSCAVGTDRLYLLDVLEARLARWLLMTGRPGAPDSFSITASSGSHARCVAPVTKAASAAGFTDGSVTWRGNIVF
jgi:hypothetical protein